MEDIGLADPQALPLAVRRSERFTFRPARGRPGAGAGGGVPGAGAQEQRALYKAYGAALGDVAETRNEPVPLHLRSLIQADEEGLPVR
ncbi:MAG: hypothetical protein U0Z44_08670 [Kouleothrix sp.]